jgi:hypothetical protein
MKFGVVIFKEVEELDFVGPWEMLAMWSKYAQGRPCASLRARRRSEAPNGPVTALGSVAAISFLIILACACTS